MSKDKNTKKIIENSSVNTPSHDVLRHAKAVKGFAIKGGSATVKKQTLTDRYLHLFLTVESESAAKQNRQSLLVAFADGINWPFRTAEKVIEGVETTLVQVSSNWLKQHDNEEGIARILGLFRSFCENGHLVQPNVQTAFDSSFKRPCVTYTCSCGWKHEQSFVMRSITDIAKRACPECGRPASEMTITKS